MYNLVKNTLAFWGLLALHGAEQVLVTSSLVLVTSNPLGSNCLDVLVHKRLVLDCATRPHVRRSWKYNGRLLYMNKDMVRRKFKNSIMLFENYSIQIDSLALKHEGVYECNHDGTNFRTSCVKVTSELVLRYYCI